MPDPLRHGASVPAPRPGTAPRCAKLPRAVAAALVLTVACRPARAAEPCPDKFVDVYLSPLVREEGPPIRIFLKPGPPPVHLRLPRDGLSIQRPNDDVYVTDCAASSYTGFAAFYQDTDRLLRSLDIPNQQPELTRSDLRFNAHNPQPVDDSDDRDGLARMGEWIVDTNVQPAPIFSARFCLRPPALPGQCYATIKRWITYSTGNLVIESTAFSSSTFASPPSRLWNQVTIAELDSYFALLRRVANAVVIPSGQPNK